jgi:hypothetical protein
VHRRAEFVILDKRILRTDDYFWYLPDRGSATAHVTEVNTATAMASLIRPKNKMSGVQEKTKTHGFWSVAAGTGLHQRRVLQTEKLQIQEERPMLRIIARLAATSLSLTIFSETVTADDLAECRQGITMIQVEISKRPAQTTLARLQRALRDAERELKEQEVDECLDAVEDAKKALGR